MRATNQQGCVSSSRHRLDGRLLGTLQVFTALRLIYAAQHSRQLHVTSSVVFNWTLNPPVISRNLGQSAPGAEMVQVKALQQEQIGVIKERPGQRGCSRVMEGERSWGVGGQRRDLVQTSGGTMALILSKLEPLMVCDQGCVSLKVIDTYILFLLSYAGGAQTIKSHSKKFLN